LVGAGSRGLLGLGGSGVLAYLVEVAFGSGYRIGCMFGEEFGGQAREVGDVVFGEGFGKGGDGGAEKGGVGEGHEVRWGSGLEGGGKLRG
jgi:hypothetical protein